MRQMLPIFFLLLLVGTVTATPWSFSGEFRSGYYGWQERPDTATLAHHELTERLRLNVSGFKGHLDVSMYGMYRADASKDAAPNWNYFDLYHGYVRWSGVPQGVTATFGRQWITQSLGTGVLDGLSAGYRGRSWGLSAYAGGIKPSVWTTKYVASSTGAASTDANPATVVQERNTKLTDAFTGSAWYGGEVWYRLTDWRFSVAGTHQARKQSNYVFTDPAETLRTLTESNLEAERALAEAAILYHPGDLSLNLKTWLDYNMMSLDRVRFRTMYHQADLWRADGEILYKKPRVSFTTLWDMLQNDGMLIGRVGGYWNFMKPLGAGVRYQFTNAGTNNLRHRVTFDVAYEPIHAGFYLQSAPNTSLWGMTLGGVYDWSTTLSSGASLDFGRYKLDKDVGPEEDFLSLRVWGSVEPVKDLSLSLELQNYSNWYLRSDFRVWAEVGYRFRLGGAENAEELR